MNIPFGHLTATGPDRAYRLALHKVREKSWRAITEADLVALESRDTWLGYTTRRWVERERRRAGISVMETTTEFVQRRQRELMGIVKPRRT
jgi:hypothetical protein